MLLPQIKSTNLIEKLNLRGSDEIKSQTTLSDKKLVSYKQARYKGDIVVER